MIALVCVHEYMYIVVLMKRYLNSGVSLGDFLYLGIENKLQFNNRFTRRPVGLLFVNRYCTRGNYCTARSTMCTCREDSELARAEEKSPMYLLTNK
jgi:hypothetical protein